MQEGRLIVVYESEKSLELFEEMEGNTELEREREIEEEDKESLLCYVQTARFVDELLRLNIPDLHPEAGVASIWNLSENEHEEWIKELEKEIVLK